MRNRYNDKELADQLKLDLAEGESWHIEFKEYDHRRLDEKIADSWKDELSHELAAFASIGGKIYIGISDDGTIKGIGGSHQIWQEKLFERAVGRIRPKVNWKSYHFADPATGLSLIRLDVLEGEPIYYVQGKPYIREGTKSRPAEPEEVKARSRNRGVGTVAHSRKPGQRPSKAYKARRDIIEVHGDMNKAGRDINIAQGDINFGTVSNPQDFAAQLERLKAELVAAKEAGVLSEEEATDAEYDVTKASQQAKKDHPDKNAILDYLNKAKTLLEGVTAATGLVPSVVSAIEAVHKLFS